MLAFLYYSYVQEIYIKRKRIKWLYKELTSIAIRTAFAVSLRFLYCDVFDRSFSIKISFCSSMDLSISPFAGAITSVLLSVIFTNFNPIITPKLLQIRSILEQHLIHLVMPLIIVKHISDHYHPDILQLITLF